MPPRGQTAIPRRRKAPTVQAEPVTPPRQTGNAHLLTPGEQFDLPPTSELSSDNSDVEQAIVPILVSPIKRRQRRAAPSINRLKDLEIWGMTDDEILGESNLFVFS